MYFPCSCQSLGTVKIRQRTTASAQVWPGKSFGNSSSFKLPSNPVLTVSNSVASSPFKVSVSKVIYDANGNIMRVESLYERMVNPGEEEHEVLDLTESDFPVAIVIHCPSMNCRGSVFVS